MKVHVASKNPVKMNATKEAFQKFFKDKNIELVGFDVDSGVPSQPFNDETFIGAQNRAESLYKEGSADYYVGIEGGINLIFNRYFEIGCVCIIDKNGKKSFGNTSMFEIPEKIVKECTKGKELGSVVDTLFGSTNIKQKGGAISVFSNEIMSRTEVTMNGVMSALIPFINQSIYFDSLKKFDQ